jgi:hypothetical protein
MSHREPPRVLHRPPHGWGRKRPDMLPMLPLYFMAIVWAVIVGTVTFSATIETLRQLIG